MSLYSLSKKAALDVYSSLNPVNVLFGNVVKEKPLEIEVHQKLTLTEEFLVLTKHIMKDDSLSKGNKVILLRVQGGHQFVVLDKVVG